MAVVLQQLCGRAEIWLGCGLLCFGCLKLHEVSTPLTACVRDEELEEQRT